MRLAFNLIATPHALAVDLYDAAQVSEGSTPPIARVLFDATGKSTPRYAGTIFNAPIVREDGNLTLRLSKINADAASHSPRGSLQEITPLLFARALLASNAVQLAHDPQLKKFRVVRTMKEGKDSWKVVGTDIVVEAEDAEVASRIAKREVANAMAESPEKAEKLVKFFTGGCKVEKLASGKLPEYVKVESLAYGTNEEKLAKEPIKVSRSDDDKK